MKIKTKFFGTIDFNPKEIVEFPEGIPGFEHSHRFMLYQPENSVFACLQAVEQVEVAFITISPFLVCADYAFDLDEQTVNRLELKSLEDALLLALVTIPEGNLQKSTANLKAPVIINLKTHMGYQIILNDDYPLRVPLVDSKTDRKDKIHK